MTDLGRVLDDLRDAGTGAAGAPPTEHILRRRRRRRTARLAGAGTGVLALAGAVALSAGALADRDPLPTADGTPSDEAYTTPVVVPNLPWCGEPVPTGADDSSWVAAATVGTPLPDGRSQVDVHLRTAPDSEYVASGGSVRDGALLMVQDGVVVGHAVSPGDERAFESTSEEGAHVLVQGEVERCEDVEVTGDAELVAAVEVRWEWGRLPGGNTAVADSTYAWLLVGSLPVQSGNDVPTVSWVEVEAAALPDDVPLVTGHSLRAQSEPTSGRWRTVVEAETGRSTAEDVRAAFLDAGFRLESEETDEARPFWWHGVFGSDRWTVTVDVSNETGGGFLVDYLLEPLDR